MVLQKEFLKTILSDMDFGIISVCNQYFLQSIGIRDYMGSFDLNFPSATYQHIHQDVHISIQRFIQSTSTMLSHMCSNYDLVQVVILFEKRSINCLPFTTILHLTTILLLPIIFHYYSFLIIYSFITPSSTYLKVAPSTVCRPKPAVTSPS